MANDAKVTGICPVCLDEYRVKHDGRLYRHGSKRGEWPPKNCEGTGQRAQRLYGPPDARNAVRAAMEADA